MFNCEVQYKAAQGIYAEYTRVSDCHLSFNGLSGIDVEYPGYQIIGNASYNDNTTASANDKPR